MKFTDNQLTKTSEYLLDISKLLIGATFVPIFAPGAVQGFNLWLFGGGIILAGFFFGIGLKLLTPKL